MLTCSCTFLKSDNYLIKYKKNNLHRVGGNLRISIYIRVYSGIKYVVQLNLPVRPEGLQVTEGNAGSLLLGTILKRAFYRTLLYALCPDSYTSNETSWTMVPGMHGTHCKYNPLVSSLVFNNNLDLLVYGCMWDGMYAYTHI